MKLVVKVDAAVSGSSDAVLNLYASGSPSGQNNCSLGHGPGPARVTRSLSNRSFGCHGQSTFSYLELLQRSIAESRALQTQQPSWRPSSRRSTSLVSSPDLRVVAVVIGKFVKSQRHERHSDSAEGNNASELDKFVRTSSTRLSGMVSSSCMAEKTCHKGRRYRESGPSQILNVRAKGHASTIYDMLCLPGFQMLGIGSR